MTIGMAAIGMAVVVEVAGPAVRAAVAAVAQVEVPAVAVVAALEVPAASVVAVVGSMRSAAMPICPEETWPRAAKGGC